MKKILTALMLTTLIAPSKAMEQFVEDLSKKSHNLSRQDNQETLETGGTDQSKPFQFSFDSSFTNEQYSPEDKEKLNIKDVVSLIHEGNFSYDNVATKTYLSRLKDALGWEHDFSNDCLYYCCEELAAHYFRNKENALQLKAEDLMKKFK